MPSQTSKKAEANWLTKIPYGFLRRRRKDFKKTFWLSEKYQKWETQQTKDRVIVN